MNIKLKIIKTIVKVNYFGKGSMTSKPLVSIITPCYNCSQYVHRLLDSILNQTYDQIELIFVNDGSIDDNTKKIYLKFKKIKKVNIRFFKIKNIGPSGARNFGLKKIKYDYFCFFDPDDFMHKNFINNRLQIFK